ncbi:sulfotransferase domain-containing protein [Pacificibacter sp. AS14]|uniref:sulfotransferase domain-containing protein n=1 Tax=Pacificibacter sp. AS14 TaxID=3135785 RepID=UPI0031811F34
MKSTILKSLWGLGGTSTPCFISGSPRSGTTWILEVLEKIAEARIHWEPLNWHLYNSAYDRSTDPLNWMRPNEETLENHPELAQELSRILKGGVPSKPAMMRIAHLSAIQNAVRLVSAKDTVVKFVFAQRALSWMAKNTAGKGCVILRHPMSVVSSQYHHPYRPDGKWAQHPEWTDEVICASHPMVSLLEATQYSALERLMKIDLLPEGRLAITACLDMLAALNSPEAKQKYAFVAYESLLGSPENFLKLANFLDLRIKVQPTVEELRKRSRTTSDQNKNSGTARLSCEARDQIQMIIDELGLGFYKQDGSLDHAALKALKLPNLISD